MENPDALFVLLLWFDLSMWNFGFIVFSITRPRAEVNVTIVIFWLRTSRPGDGSVTCPKSVIKMTKSECRMRICVRPVDRLVLKPMGG